MNPDKPPPPRRKLKSGFDYLRAGLRSIPTGSKVRHAINEAKRFGASGKELGFVLMTIRHRVLATGREMQEGLSWQKLEALKRLNAVSGVDAATVSVLGMIDAARAEAKKSPKVAPEKKPKKPGEGIEGVSEKTVEAIGGVASFGWDNNIATRYNAFKNLMNVVQKPECERVCHWLEAMGGHYMYGARHAKSYSQHASQADFALRCYGAAGFIYGKHGFKKQQFESQKLGYALNARLGLA